MSDERSRRERLKIELGELEAKRTQILEELMHLAARVPERRRQFGNPFYYSHPEEPDEGIANYNPHPGSETGWQTWRSLRRVDRELERIRAELRRFDSDAPPH